jgi:hypothetical protein
MRIPFLSHEANTIFFKFLEAPVEVRSHCLSWSFDGYSSVCMYLFFRRNVQLVILYQRKIVYVDSGYFLSFQSLEGLTKISP